MNNLFNAQISQYATPTVTGEGSVTLENNVRCYLPEMDVTGNTFQQTYAGTNLATAYQIFADRAKYTETEYQGKNCIMFRCDKATEKVIEGGFKENTQYTIHCWVYAEDVYDNGDAAYINIVNYTDGTRSSYYAPKKGEWIETTHTTDAGKTVQSIGMKAWAYKTNVYIDVDTFQINEGTKVLAYEPYVGGIYSPNPGQTIKQYKTEEQVTDVSHITSGDYTTDDGWFVVFNTPIPYSDFANATSLEISATGFNTTNAEYSVYDCIVIGDSISTILKGNYIHVLALGDGTSTPAVCNPDDFPDGIFIACGNFDGMDHASSYAYWAQSATITMTQSVQVETDPIVIPAYPQEIINVNTMPKLKPNIPKEYQEVEYIESTGTQFININRPVNNFEAIVARTVDTTEYIGCFISKSVQRCQINISSTAVGFGIGNDDYSSNYGSIEYSTGTNFQHYKITKDGLYINGTQAVAYTVEYAEPNAGGTLFGRRDVRATTTALTNTGKMKIKRAKFYNGSTLVFNFIPCYNKLTGVIGMYDLVSNSFYSNSGTGVFLKGADVNQLPNNFQRVEYIETTGTQWIDTTYYPTNKTKVELDLEMSNGKSTASGSNIFNTTDDIKRFSVNFGSTAGETTKIYVWTNIINTSGGIICSVDVGNTVLTRNKLVLTNSKFTYGTYSLDTEPSTWTTLGVSLKLFCNSSGQAFNRYNIKLYEMKIWDNDMLVRHFVPCYQKTDSKIGLYDLVNKSFYANSGTGTFNKGKEIGSLNLFDENEVTVGKHISAEGVEGNNTHQRLSDYIEIEPSTTYRLSDVYNTFTIFSESSAQTQYDRCACYDENKTLISVLFALARSQKGQHTTTFETPWNAKYIRITQGKFAEKTMLTKGEEFVDYLPCGNYGSKIAIHGKNLVDDAYNVLFHTSTYANRLKRVEKDGRNCIYYIHNTGRQYVIEGGFKENTQYTISFDCLTGADLFGSGTGTPILMFFYTDGTRSNIINSNKEWKHGKLTSTAGKTVKSIGTTSYTNVEIWIDVDTFMLQEGAEETPYEPYLKEEIAIPTKLTANNGNILTNGESVADGKTIPLLMSKYDKLTVNTLTNKVIYSEGSWQRVLTGKESWARNDWAYNNNYGTYYVVSANYYWKVIPQTGVGYCSHFKALPKFYHPADRNSFVGYAGEGLFQICTDRVTPVKDFKLWLQQKHSEGDPVVVFVKRTAENIQEHDITNTDFGQQLLALTTGKGTNYLEITGNLAPTLTATHLTHS